DTMKCPIEKRPYPPGIHGRGRIRESEYMLQLREKQKAKRIYGMLEQRLDNVVFRAGFASSRNQSRQWVRHGHILVNGKRVTIPSYMVRKEDVIEFKAKSKDMIVLQHNLDTIDRTVPMWLEVTDGKATVRDLPLREQIDIPVREQLIVELYSK
ncbi:MAG: 30S ribosomal protein S4, partial [Acidimicrobiia bacterium]